MRRGCKKDSVRGWWMRRGCEKDGFKRLADEKRMQEGWC